MINLTESYDLRSLMACNMGGSLLKLSPKEGLTVTRTADDTKLFAFTSGGLVKIGPLPTSYESLYASLQVHYGTPESIHAWYVSPANYQAAITASANYSHSGGAFTDTLTVLGYPLYGILSRTVSSGNDAHNMCGISTSLDNYGTNNHLFRGALVTNYSYEDLDHLYGIDIQAGLASGKSCNDELIGLNVSVVKSSTTASKSWAIKAEGANVALFADTGTDGDLVVKVGNAATVPTTDPTGGGVLYAEGGALKWRGSSGTVTTVAPA